MKSFKEIRQQGMERKMRWQQYKILKFKGFSVNSCHIFVGANEEFFLGACPDGIADDDYPAEVKCTKSLRNISIDFISTFPRLQFSSVAPKVWVGKQI